MENDLERRLKALKSARNERMLDGLEQRVWQRIARERSRWLGPAMLVPARVLAVILALGTGIVGGELSVAARPRAPMEIAALSIQPDLAPSTLLGLHP